MVDRPPGPPIEWFTGGKMDYHKFDAYLLCPTHPVGKHKLRLWKSVFGIEEGDGKLLQRLIREQLDQATPQEQELQILHSAPAMPIRRWELIIPRFKGPNGREGPVLTAWALDPEAQRPHFVTAYPIVD